MTTNSGEVFPLWTHAEAGKERGNMQKAPVIVITGASSGFASSDLRQTLTVNTGRLRYSKAARSRTLVIVVGRGGRGPGVVSSPLTRPPAQPLDAATF